MEANYTVTDSYDKNIYYNIIECCNYHVLNEVRFYYWIDTIPLLEELPNTVAIFKIKYK